MLAEPLAQFDCQDVAYDAWEHLCADAFDGSERGVIALLTAYFDASYNQPPSHPLIHTVGGYAAFIDDWKRFRKEWREELQKKGLAYFHMNEFEYARSTIIAGRTLSQSSPYFGWPEEAFIPFLKRLHQVINRKRRDGSFRMAGFINSVGIPDFLNALPNELKDDPGCKTHYIFNVAVLMEHMAQLLNKERYNGLIHYVFAGGDGEGGNLERWFDQLYRNDLARKHYRLSKGYSRIGYDIQWAKSEPALQAADIAAFEFNKAALIAAETKQPLKLDAVRKSLPNLCRTYHNGKLLMEQDFANLSLRCWSSNHGTD